MADCPPDLAALRAQHPDWAFAAVWVTPSTGAGSRILRAERGTVRLSARDPADLARQIDVIQRTRP